MSYDQLLPDYVGQFQHAYDQGRQRTAQKGLASLASGYYAQQGNDTLAKMAAYDPGAAVQFSKVQQDDQAQQKAQLGELAGYLLSVPEEQRAAVWQTKVAPLVDKLIPGAGQEPYGPHIADIAQWAVQEYGPKESWSNAGNGLMLSNQGHTKEIPGYEPAQHLRPIMVPDGKGGAVQMMFDPATGQTQPMNYGGSQAAPQPAATFETSIDVNSLPPAEQEAAKLAAQGQDVYVKDGQVHAGSTLTKPPVASQMGYKPPRAPAASAPKPLAAGNSSDQDAVDTYTADYIMHGKMPALGMGNSGRRDAVAANVARIAKTLGLTPGELLTKSADYKAGAMSLQNLQKQSDMLERNEQTFKNNADVMLHLSDTVARSGIPAFNALILKAKTNVAGDPDAAAFAAARKIVAQEYAKIASGATGSAGSTDSAQAHALELIDNAHTPAQLRAVVATLTKDADGQKAANKQQADEIRGRLKDAVSTKPSGGPKPGDIEDGYQFKGGNPSDKNNWVKASP
jgi:hypothetical protein